jgi:hypothetical protein
MKKLQLEPDKEYLDNTYYSTNTFAVVYDSIVEDIITAPEWFDSCREVVCDRIRTRFQLSKTFDMEKLKLLVRTKFIAHYGGELTNPQKNLIKKRKLAYNKAILIGLKIVNLVEKKFKWPLTKIYPVECKQLDENNIFYYFIASKKWIKSPNMFSLFMLLLRVGTKIKEYTTFRTLDGFYKSLQRNKNTVDINYLKTHYKRILLVLKHYNRLFGKTSMRDLYIPSTPLNLFPEGINSLCDLNTNDLSLRKRFVKILNEEKELRSWEKDDSLKKEK